jgi:CRP-like cAMP-binding protein
MAAEIPELTDFFQKRNFTRNFNKGYLICSQEETFEYVYMVKTGVVKMYDLDNTGSERTIAIFANESVFPLTWLLNNPPKSHLYFYEAFADSVCYIVSKDDLHAFTLENPVTILGVLDALTKSYMNLAARIRNLEKSHVREKLEFVLYMLANQLGTFQGNVAQIDTTITQEDISRLAGVTRESVSLEMNNAPDLIWKDGRHTFIDVGKINTSDMPAILGE